MTAPLQRAALLNYLQTELGVETAALQDEQPLFSAGVIDSFSLVSLLAFIEEQCGIRVRPDDVTLENFDSLARMTAYVARRIAEDAA